MPLSGDAWAPRPHLPSPYGQATSGSPYDRTGTAMRQAILMSAAILAYVLLTQYGRRRFSWRGWLSAVIGIPAAAAIYLARAPGRLDDIYLYLASAAVGLGFGTLASLATGVERDRETGQLYTRCGVA